MDGTSCGHESCVCSVIAKQAVELVDKLSTKFKASEPKWRPVQTLMSPRIRSLAPCCVDDTDEFAKVMCGISLEADTCLVNHVVAGAWSGQAGSPALPPLFQVSQLCAYVYLLAPASPEMRAWRHQGDEIIAVNGEPVSASTVKGKLQAGPVCELVV